MLKKFSLGAWMACVTAVLTIASLIVYTMNVNGAGYFKNATVTNLTTFCILAALALVCAIVLSLVKLNGPVGTVLNVVTGALQIIAPVLLALCLINLVAARAEGLGFIYFSNADVLLEVQTPANLSSATGAIASMVCLGVSTVVGIVAAFFNVRKSA